MSLTRPQTALAWVNCNGIGTVAINDSFNVSSITDNGTGDYTVNFEQALVDANYAVSVMCRSTTTAYGKSVVSNVSFSTAPTTSAIRIDFSFQDDNSNAVGYSDSDMVSLIVFGGAA